MIPFRLLFWNVGLTVKPPIVARLVKEYGPDIIVLAESKHINSAVLVETLSEETGFLYQMPFNVVDRIQFFVRMPPERVRPFYDGNYFLNPCSFCDNPMIPKRARIQEIITIIKRAHSLRRHPESVLFL